MAGKKPNKIIDKKVRVAHIITQLDIGGASKNTIYTVDYLNKHGYYSEIISGPAVHNSNLMAEARKRGIMITVIEGIVNRIALVKNLKALFKLTNYLRNNRFGIVHTHSSVAGIIGRLAAWLAGTPIIIHTVHGWGIRADISRFKQKMYILLERLCERFTDKLIVVSRFNIDKGLKYKIGERSKYVVIHSGIDVKKFSKKIDVKKKKNELGLDPGLPVVGMIGRLDAQKNPLDFVRVAHEVQRKFPEVQFIIVGDGLLRKQTETMIKKLNLKKFYLLGFRSDVDEIIQVIDISALTSLWEGLPRVFAESMAAKKPIVANNVDGAPEAIIDGRNGFIVPPHNTNMFAEKILYLLRNPEKAKVMGMNGYKRVNEFSKEKMLRDIDNLYKKIISG